MATMVHDMKAILGEDFFKEEVRCEYLVSAKMKRAWAVLLDMYLAFSEICDKYGLKYFAIGGTLLGAVRHNGFIPWDDDFDIGMFRKDYETFLKIANDELQQPLFLQTPYTDKGYYGSAAKIRNSSTAAVIDVLKHNRFNQGLFIDIFPMDFCDPKTIEEDTYKVYVSAKKCGVSMRKGSKYLNDRQKKDEITFATDNPLKEWEYIQAISADPKYMNSKYLCNTVYTGDPFQLRMHPTECYSKIIEQPFESIKVNIPAGYDTILKIMYKDYMSYPPIEERGARHSNIIFDPDKPYTLFLE